MSEKKKTSEKILDTAFNCLAEHGYASVSMRGIAKESGTALSQLTYHFQTKEKLFLAVIDMMTQQYISEVEVLMQERDGAKEKLGALVQYFKDMVKENPKLLRLFMDLSAQAIWVSSFRKKVNSLIGDLAVMIDTEIVGKKTSVSDDQKRPTARLIFGALYGASVQMLLGDEVTEPDALAMFELAESLI